MKKLTFLAAAMAMMALTMTSCQKEEGILASDIIFTATTESGNSKTHLEGLNLKWDMNDEIVVMERTYFDMEIFRVVSTDGNYATFTAVGNTLFLGNEFSALYPKTLVDDHLLNDGVSDVALPATQTYAESSINGFPMYAPRATGNTFHFNNICGVMRLNLQQSGVSIRQIKITTDKGICGQFRLSQVDGKYVVNAFNSNYTSNTVTLDCGENGVDISTAKDFNIYLPAGEYNAFDIEITATDGSVCTKSLNGRGDLTIVRNQITTLTCNGNMNFVSQMPVSVIFNGEEVEFTTIFKATYQSMGPQMKEYHLELTDNYSQRTISIVIDYVFGEFNLSTIDYVDENNQMWTYVASEGFSCNAASDNPNTISFDIVGAYMWGVTLRPMDVYADNITFIEGEF